MDLPGGHKVRTTDHMTAGHMAQETGSAPDSVWRTYGEDLLKFHRRQGLTAMCQCGETLVTCSVLALARQYGLLPRNPSLMPGTTRLPDLADA